MAAAYLVSTGLSLEQPWNTIREVRPFIRPTDVQKQQLRLSEQEYYPDVVLLQKMR